uniref:Uncharacterized protein n=1 Tax=mine drainage metagenome TaxID=410659 RepID=E6QVU8_9ZZZZ
MSNATFKLVLVWDGFIVRLFLHFSIA